MSWAMTKRSTGATDHYRSDSCEAAVPLGSRQRIYQTRRSPRGAHTYRSLTGVVVAILARNQTIHRGNVSRPGNPNLP